MTIALIVVGALIAFFLFWNGIIFLLSLVGGWHSLGGHYPQSGDVTPRWTYKSGRMRGFVNYNGILNLGVNEQGLHLSVVSLFRAGHPPLFIPWREIQISEGRRFFLNTTEFDFPRAGTRLSLSRKLGNEILAARDTASWPA